MNEFMNNVVSRARCYECAGTMEGRKGEYKYIECGLTSVILKDILIFRCTNCNAVVPEIPAAGILHRVIALRLLNKKNLLTGSEVRFLRKFCGYSVTEFAEILGSSKSVVSRWEKSGSGKETDRIVRLLLVNKLMRELVGQPESILKNVTVERLLGEIENTFKLIEGKGKASDRYEITPKDISDLIGVPDDSRELVAPVQ
jgi:transcriptional regulator with XRE-family HTH domain